MLDLSVIILTKDEKLHITRCLERLLPLYLGYDEKAPSRHGSPGILRPSKLPAGRVFVVDCLSTDGTQEIARSYGAEVVEHAWPGLYATQLNWALDNLPVKTKWVLRLDADEYLREDTINEVKKLLPTLDEDVSSLSLPRARTWMGESVSRGVGAVILKRFFRYGLGRCEERQMDEHIVTTQGRDVLLKGAFVDDNLNPLSWWTVKHLNYAEREARDLLMHEFGVEAKSEAVVGGQAGAKRKLKGRYARLPLFWRSFAYFCYRYFLRGGFLEGRRGFTWHFFQGWWYRTMVDARICEIKKMCNNDPARIKAYLEETTTGRR